MMALAGATPPMKLNNCVQKTIVELADYSTISLTSRIPAPGYYLAIGTLEQCHGERKLLHGHTHAGPK